MKLMGRRFLPEFPGILDPLRRLSSPLSLRCRKFVTELDPSLGIPIDLPASKFRLKSSYNHNPFTCRYLPLKLIF